VEEARAWHVTHGCVAALSYCQRLGLQRDGRQLRPVRVHLGRQLERLQRGQRTLQVLWA
jgi:hypothetical protein